MPAQFPAQLSQSLRTMRFRYSQERIKVRAEIFQFNRTEFVLQGNRRRRTRDSRPEPSMQVFLKASDMNVKLQNLCGE